MNIGFPQKKKEIELNHPYYMATYNFIKKKNKQTNLGDRERNE